jgi:branched-chain amino acid transport system ATP-binding protein
MPRPLLEVADLTVTYDRFLALDGVDLAVPEGMVVALLGPNGAGKSTLLKTVAGLVPAAGGTISLRGRSLEGLTAHDRSRQGVCLIPEGRGIFPVLGTRRKQLAGTLSGGEQQMLALARAIGSDPQLLMADELSLGLAPLLVKTITETLERLHQEEGRTILLVEQYATHALRLADLVYILNRGRLAFAGEPDELRKSKVLADRYLGA